MSGPRKSGDEDNRPVYTGRSPSPTTEWPVTDDAIREVFAAMLQDGSWGRYHGPHCDRLRSELASYFTVPRVHLCSSGTAAVELALRAANVGVGDEVALCAYDFKANFVNVLMLGAVPVLVDAMPERPKMDVAVLADAWTERTRAVIVSHLHGCLTDIDAVRAAIGSRPITLIEDACQCPGASINGRRAGSLGDIGVLSFGGSKLLTSGRGGALLMHDAQLAQRVTLQTQRGNDVNPLSEMQAAVLLPQLKQLDARHAARREGATAFVAAMGSASSGIRQNSDEHLESLRKSGDFRYEGSRKSGDFRNGELQPDLDPAFYKLGVLLDEAVTPHRAQLACYMQQAGILVDAAFPALHRIHGRRRFRSVGDLPHASRLHDSQMVLHHTMLTTSRMSPAEVANRVSERVVALRLQ